MKLHKRQPYLQSAPEGLPRRRRGPSLFRWFYFVVLALLVGFVTVFVAKHAIFFVYGEGQVALAKHDVRAKASCEVIEYLVEERQEVKVGDPLARLIYLPDGGPLDNEVTITRELAILKAELRQKQEDLQESILLAAIRPEKESDNTSLSRMRDFYYLVKDEVDDLTLQIRLLESRLAAHSASPPMPEGTPMSEEMRAFSSIVYAKVAGSVFRIAKQPFEYAEQGEPLLVMERPDDVMVYARFGADSLRYLTAGKEALVVFPDGETAAARISRAYTYSYYFEEKNEPSEDIIVELVPEDVGSSALWKAHKGTEVTVRVERIGIGGVVSNVYHQFFP